MDRSPNHSKGSQKKGAKMIATCSICAEFSLGELLNPPTFYVQIPGLKQKFCCQLCCEEYRAVFYGTPDRHKGSLESITQYLNNQVNPNGIPKDSKPI
jgi:hypothetical protein